MDILILAHDPARAGPIATAAAAAGLGCVQTVPPTQADLRAASIVLTIGLTKDEFVGVQARVRAATAEPRPLLFCIVPKAAAAQSAVDNGADDYLVDGAWEMPELLLRLELLARRARQPRSVRGLPAGLTDVLVDAISSTATDAVICRGKDGAVILWNKAAEALYGYTAAEAIGTLPEFLAQDDDPPAAPRLERIRNGHDLNTQLTMRRHKDGHRFEVELSVFPVRDASGEIAAFASFSRSADPRRKAEANERALSDRVREMEVLGRLRDRLGAAGTDLDIVEAVMEALDAVFAPDRLSVRTADEAFSNVSSYAGARGLSEGYMEAMGKVSFWDRGDDFAIPLALSDVTSAPIPEDFREAILAEGVVSLLNCSMISRGRMVGSTNVYYDTPRTFTQREIELGQSIAAQAGLAIDRFLARRALSESLAMLSLTYGSASVGLAVVDDDGRFASANAMWNQVFGYTEAELAERRLVDLIPEAGVLLAADGDDGRATGNSQFQLGALRASGERIVVEASSARFRRRQQRFHVVSLRDVTAERRAEDLAYRLGRVVEGSTNEVFQFDATTLRYTDANSAALRNLGYTSGELRLLTPLEITMGLTEDLLRENTTALTNGEREQLVFDLVHRRKDGTTYPVEARLMLSNRDGAPAFIAITEDVSLRQRLQAVAREREAYLETVVNGAPMILVVLDRDGVIVESNGAGLAKLGMDARTMVGRSFFEVMSDRSDLAEFARRALDGEELVAEIQLGGYLWQSRYAPLRDGRGELVGSIAVSLDVTEGRATEAALRASEANLRGVIGASPDGFVLLQGDPYAVVASNPAAQAWCAAVYRRGFDVGDVLAAATGAGNDLSRALDRCRTGEVVRFEGAAVDDPNVVFEVVCMPVAARPGLVDSVIISIRDISERRRAEKELLQSQKLESLAVLAGGIAHDFNNLLVGIVGNASLALEELPAGAPAAETIRDIELAGHRAADLARQMLAYAGRGQLQVQSVNVNDLVGEMIQLIRAAISKGVEIDRRFSSGIPLIQADATQIRQIVMNLVINASDAIGGKDGSIMLTTGVVQLAPGECLETWPPTDLAGGEYVFLDVTDTGSGMDAQTMNRIFDPFFTTKFAGRGLGLAAVLGIARGHGGALQVRSELGKGSTFRLLLPPAASAGAATVPVDIDDPEWKTTGVVLIADDEPTVRAVTARALSTFGLDSIQAIDGAQAVEFSSRDDAAYDLIILDMTMPGLNGVQALEAIRQVRPATPVLIMSGYAEVDAASQFTGTAATGFLQKPFQLVELRRAVRRALAAR